MPVQSGGRSPSFGGRLKVLNNTDDATACLIRSPESSLNCVRTHRLKAKNIAAMSTSTLLAAPDDPELKISTKMADYFEALYAEEENDKKPRGSLSNGPRDSGSTTARGMELGVECPCDGIPTADNSRNLGGPLLTRPSLVLSGASPAELTTGPQTLTHQCQCANANCGNLTSSHGRHNSEFLSAKMCDACGYERRRHNHLPPSLQVPHMHPSTHCANVNCGKSILGQAKRNSALITGGKLCRACGNYEGRHGEARPLAIAHPPTHCANANCGTSITNNKTRFNSMLFPGGKLCRACGNYEGKHGAARPLSLINRQTRRAKRL
ncbi:hypothetical protein B0H16DRAFT_1735162 [Mycena metata]|uniref:GATA-type domain-containing protein n=1 Tax=Mycena metata TaxID=1033252 RepID=A0AAD7MQD2_9AGAR|nr:hypothetical protein B0H16DRAFT_1735162 [Mycena metata]